MTPHEKDIKLAEIIGACMGAMTPDGLHWLLCEAVKIHHAKHIQGKHCETCQQAYDQDEAALAERRRAATFRAARKAAAR